MVPGPSCTTILNTIGTFSTVHRMPYPRRCSATAMQCSMNGGGLRVHRAQVTCCTLGRGDQGWQPHCLCDEPHFCATWMASTVSAYEEMPWRTMQQFCLNHCGEWVEITRDQCFL